MLFWILISILALAVLIAFLAGITDSYAPVESAFMGSFATAFIGTLIGGAIMIVVGIACAPVAPTATGTDTHALRAVGTESGVNGKLSGSLYLTTGYINTTRVLNYTWQDTDGDVHVDSANGDASVVREDGATNVEVHHWRMDGPWWFVPWDFGHRDTYTFHVPAGSVQGGYEVGTK